MNKEELARISLESGAKFPYDAPDEWWSNGHQYATLPASDKARTKQPEEYCTTCRTAK